MDTNEAELAVQCITRQNQYAEGLCQEIQELRAENKRLREALEKVIEADGLICSLGPLNGSALVAWGQAAAAARAALKGTADD